MKTLLETIYDISELEADHAVFEIVVNERLSELGFNETQIKGYIGLFGSNEEGQFGPIFHKLIKEQ